MRIGDVIESAIWITGEESAEMRARYELDVRNAIGYLCHEHGFVHGPVIFIEKRPEEDKVPAVPDHVQGQRVRLLVGESTVIKEMVASPKGSFVANLEHKDLMRLRAIIRRERNKSLGAMNGTVMADEECDNIIEQIGPEAAVDTLRQLH